MTKETLVVHFDISVTCEVVSTRAIACTVVLGEWGGEIIIIIRRLKLSRHFHIISISSVLLKMQSAFRAKIVVLGKNKRNF